MELTIRHFPERKRPCIVLEEKGHRPLIIGYLTDRKREKWLKMALMFNEDSPVVIHLDTSCSFDKIYESVGYT